MVVKKEIKFFVLKIADIEKYLSNEEKWQLDNISKTIEAERLFDNTKKNVKNKYIVCNQDEPYAEKVWQTILDGEREKEKSA